MRFQNIKIKQWQYWGGGHRGAYTSPTLPGWVELGTTSTVHMSYDLPACARLCRHLYSLPVGQVKLVGYEDVFFYNLVTQLKTERSPLVIYC